MSRSSLVRTVGISRVYYSDEATPSRCLGYYIPDYFDQANPQKGIDLTFNCASRHKEPSHPEQDATFPPALLWMPFYPFTQQIAAQLGALNHRASNPFFIRCAALPSKGGALKGHLSKRRGL